MSFDTFDILRGLFDWANGMVRAEPQVLSLALGTAGLWLVWQVITLALPQHRA